MSDDWCTRKGPRTGGRCSKRWSNEHPEHHSLETGERWTDAQAEEVRATRSIRRLTSRPIVIIESPYAGNLKHNARYLDACLLDSLRRDEAPFASHGLYTRPGVLRDSDSAERELGIQAGFAFRRVAALTAVYTDLGISSGMQRGIDDANESGCRIEYRQLGGEWMPCIEGRWCGRHGCTNCDDGQP